MLKSEINGVSDHEKPQVVYLRQTLEILETENVFRIVPCGSNM